MKVSERQIAVQLFVDGYLIELLPINSSYFQWEQVEFPRFLGSSNRSKVDSDLQVFLNDLSGAKIISIRELKEAFADICISEVPNCLVDHLVKRMALTSIRHCSSMGFYFDSQRSEDGFGLLCDVLEELAAFERVKDDPLSPLHDLFQDIQALEAERKQRMLRGLRRWSSLAQNTSWANSLLLKVHLEYQESPRQFVENAQDTESWSAYTMAYTLFVEYQLGQETYDRFVDLLGNLVKNSTVESGELTNLFLKYWESSLKWWNLSEIQRRPWYEMSSFQHSLMLPRGGPKDALLTLLCVETSLLKTLRRGVLQVQFTSYKIKYPEFSLAVVKKSCFFNDVFACLLLWKLVLFCLLCLFSSIFKVSFVWFRFVAFFSDRGSQAPGACFQPWVFNVSPRPSGPYFKVFWGLVTFMLHLVSSSCIFSGLLKHFFRAIDQNGQVKLVFF